MNVTSPQRATLNKDLPLSSSSTQLGRTSKKASDSATKSFQTESAYKRPKSVLRKDSASSMARKDKPAYSDSPSKDTRAKSAIRK